MTQKDTVLHQVLKERNQSHDTRLHLFNALEKELDRPVVSFFTSFQYPVMIEDNDADMLEGILQKMNLSKGLALIINSPGGSGLSAERIVNICRNYSSKEEYWAIVPNKAKSAATMICFGASKIYMGVTSELGPVDPQIQFKKDDTVMICSVYNIIKSYEKLFSDAVQSDGNLEPYLQQLAHYDERQIQEFRAALELSDDITVRTLAAGMMKGLSEKDIKKKIKIFLTPERTKTHGRPIYREEALTCDLKIEFIDKNSNLYKLIYELYIRTDNYVSTKASKCIESKYNSFIVPL